MPKFKLGEPRPPNAGRKKGTPNKATLSLQQVLESHGVNPADKLLDLLPQLEPAKQADVHLRLMEFIYPKRKALETASPDEAADRISIIEEFRAVLNDPRNERVAKPPVYGSDPGPAPPSPATMTMQTKTATQATMNQGKARSTDG